MFNINNKYSKAIASLLFSSLVVLAGGDNYAYADFDYSEHHYKTYNNMKENVSDKDTYLASNPKFKNSIPSNDYILELQKIAADANGLKIGTYKNVGDYKLLVQPVRIKVGLDNSYNLGNFQIVLGTEDLRKTSDYEYGNSKQIRNPYMDSKIIWNIGHEMGHGVLNHGTGKHGRITAQEEDADRIAWYTLEKTSDFGWGYAFNVDTAYRTDNCNEEYVKKQTNNKLWIAGTSSDNVVYAININGAWYNAVNIFNAIIGNYVGSTYAMNYGETYKGYAIALGQLGYIYSKEKKIDVNKIAIVPENRYTYYKSKLVYKSSNMPNGYKTIAFFHSDVNKTTSFWNKTTYDSKEGYSPENTFNNIIEMKSTLHDSFLQADMAEIIAIKYAGINLFNGIYHIH